ncbi:MAG TPA: hypothetical protein PKO09_12920 [Anaerolineae bacterium]|nr:hypothetical protein [Anaerolineae bacterium]
MQRRILLLAALVLLFAAVAPVTADDALRVFYAGPDDGVRTALDLGADPELNPAGTLLLVPEPAQADVLVLNGTVPNQDLVRQRLREGAGLLLILGPELSAGDVTLLLGAPVYLEETEGNALSLTPANVEGEPLLQEIEWTSAPQVRERFLVRGETASPMPLVEGFGDGSLILGALPSQHGYLLTPFLGDANAQLQGWAYFNYLTYHLVARAGGRSPVSYADYGGSPVPHARERAVLLGALTGMLLLAVLAFWLVRRYSRAHPEALDTLLASRADYAEREARTDWEEIGFHRPLGGFLFALMFGLILFIPYVIYNNLVLPSFILPSAQALGIWGRVTQFFSLIWLLLDMGTSAAFIKFMAQYRVDDPGRAVQYGQIFVWWQALSGAFQVAVVTLVAGTLVPRTGYALYAWSVIVHSLIQLPGFYQVWRHAFMGLQRSDRAQMLDMGLMMIFPMIAQPVIVTVMVAWGRSHPVLGLSMGGLLGMGLAAYASEGLAFLLGLLLYRRLGFRARVFFLAHFDWATVKSAFRFGVFEMLGSVAWTVGQAAEILITQARLVNYAEVWGNWGIAQNFIFAYQVIANLYNGLMPAISEAISHTRRALSQYYAAMAYKWGGMISAFIGSMLLATADRFILGASGPEFVRAAAYAMPLIIWGAIQYPSWVGDNVQLGSNRPYLKSLLVAMEQVIRILLAMLLVGRFQITGLVIAYFIGLGLKDIVAYFVNHRTCFPQRFYFWQSLVAPLLAGAANYLLIRRVGGLLWRGDQLTSILVFFIGILPSYPFFAFFYGLAGGWDDATLGELRRAVDLSGFMRPLAWVFWRATALGAQVSPLHGRFPIDIFEAAQDEAAALTKERVTLK